MISGICGFAQLVRSHGGHVAATELIDVARSLMLVDVGDRYEVERTMRFCLSFASTHPQLFDELFSAWFTGTSLLDAEPTDLPDAPTEAVALRAETTEAARIHTDDAVAVEAESDDDAATAPPDGGVRSSQSAPGQAFEDGDLVGALGEPASAPPTDAPGDVDRRRDAQTVVLPDTAAAEDLELARRALTASLAERQHLTAMAATSAESATAAMRPLTRDERHQVARCASRLNRELDGAAAWRRRRSLAGAIDLRRTQRSMATTGGVPIDVRHLAPSNTAARLVVLVDLSLSVRGTSRLMLHLLHHLRSSVGSLRAFAFVDTFVPIDRALRHGEPARSITEIVRAVDVDATSDPGRALRTWWSRWHHLVRPDTHVLILSDGRCNGRDPAFEVVRRITRQSASTTWISPEPTGAWRLGRGEMARYAECVDRSLTIRSIEDLDVLTISPGARRHRGPREASDRRAEPNPRSLLLSRLR